MKSLRLVVALLACHAWGSALAQHDPVLGELLGDGAYDAARLHLEQQRETEPHDPRLLNDLAVVYTMLGDWRQAERLLRDALASDAVMAAVAANLRKLYAWRASVAYRNALEQPGEPPPAPTLTLLTVPVEPLVEATQPSEPLPHEAVAAALENWRSAWETKQLPAYYAAYETGYSPYPQLSHGGWRKLREQRILQPGPLEITLDNVDTRLFPGVAVVTFTQHFRSATLEDEVEKTLILTRQADGWKIMRELVSR